MRSSSLMGLPSRTESSSSLQEGDDCKQLSIPASQELFVGNLPLNVGEDELRAEFSKFGPVSNVRIMYSKRKTCRPGNPVPNYGFVTFENGIAVKNCLDNKPILLHGKHQLNVEEKKTRPMKGAGRTLHITSMRMANGSDGSSMGDEMKRCGGVEERGAFGSQDSYKVTSRLFRSASEGGYIP